MSFTFPLRAGLLGAFLALVQTTDLNGQQVIDFDAENAATILSSGSLDISNVTYSGCNEQFMLLTGIGPIGIDCGMLMSSGNTSAWLCQDNSELSGCTGSAPIADTLLTIANSVPGLIGESFSVNSVNNIAFIEFDVVAQGDFIGFDFIFYSNEYPSWVNTQYNDVFALLASGPGVAGPNGEGAINLAVVPETDPGLPITISSIHPGLNSAFYTDEFPPQFCANGGTERLFAMLETIPDSTYHFQFGIADGTDTALNSYVLVSGLVSGEMVGCGDPLACNYCGSAVNYADSVCTYAEYDALDTLDLGLVGTSCPSFSVSIQLEESVDGTFNSLQGEVNWSEFPGDQNPISSALIGSLSSNVLNLSMDIPTGGVGEYIGEVQLPGADFCSGYSIPLVMEISENGSAVLEVTPTWDNNLFNGDSTCSTFGTVPGEFNSPNPDLCLSFSEDEGTMTVEWSQYPASSSLEFSMVDAFICGTGSISAQYTNGSPGFYEGTFLLIANTTTGCNAISIPFSFTITDEELPPVVADINWDSGPFDGDTTCSTSGSFNGWFNDPTNYAVCGEFYFQEGEVYGLSVEWDSLPDGSDFQFDDALAWICGDAGISLQYSGGTPGFYQGQFVIQPSGYCQSILIPFSFTITDEELPPVVADIHWDSGPFDGDTTCSAYRSFNGSFNELDGFTGCESLYLNGSYEYGLSVQWDSLPEGSNVQFNSVQASLCGGGSIYGGFSGASPGHHQGQFVIQPSVNCQSILIPFSFTITDEELPPIVAEIDWFSTPFDGDTTCSASGTFSGTFNELELAGFTDCVEGLYLDETDEFGLSIQWDSLPEGSNFQFNYAEAILCSEGYIYGNFSDGSPGFHQGKFVISPPGCQSIFVPFSFTITDSNLPPVVVEVDWNASLFGFALEPFGGGTTCNDVGTFVGTFNDLTGFTECQSFSDNGNGAGISIQWDSLPENSSIQFDNLGGQLCTGESLYGDYSGGTPGHYQGQFLIQPSEFCQSLLVPFSFTITDSSLPPPPTEIDWNTGPFGGNTTCSANGAFEGTFDSTLPDTNGPNNCAWFFLDESWDSEITVQWDSLPNSSSLQFNLVLASICESGSISGDFSGGTPGYHQGQFIIQPPGSCQSILLPFSFTITDEELPPVMADIHWNNGAFDGDTTCSTNGYAEGSFINPTNYSGCASFDEVGSESGFSVEWDSLPDGSDFQFNYVNAWICETAGMSLEYSGGTPGFYQGQFVMQPLEYCQSILIPFSFTITDEELPPVMADIHWDSAPLDGDTTCSTYGFVEGWFTTLSNYTGCEEFYFNQDVDDGLSVEWDSLPDGSDFQFDDALAWICGDAGISLQYSGGTPGFYQGQFVIQPPGNCQSTLIPFSFTIAEPDPVPVVAEVNWDHPLFLEGSTCETSGYHYGTFGNPSDYDGCNEFFNDDWGNYGIWVEWDSIPEGSPLEFTSLYATVCPDWNDIGVEYSGASAGSYSGSFVIQPEESCQLIQIPFNFSVSEEPIVVATTWSSPLNGQPTCANWGTAETAFDMPIELDCQDVQWFNSEFSTLDIIWTSQATPPTVLSAGVQHCETSSAQLTFSDAQPGLHAGYLRLAPTGICEVMHIPFSIEVIEGNPTSTSLVPDWTNGFTGTECLFEGQGQASFTVPDDAYCAPMPFTLAGGISLGLEVIWTEMPTGSLMHIAGAQAEICSGEGTLQVEYTGGTGGQYAGEVILSPNDTCIEFRLPFAFELLNPTAVLEMTTEGMTPNGQGHFGVCPPMTVHFSGAASLSEDGQGALEHWVWHTANGETDTLSADAPFEWTVDEPGVEAVRLSVIDEAGCSSPLTEAIVLLGSPTPVIELDWSETVCAGSPGFVEVLNLDAGGWQNGDANVAFEQPVYNADFGQFDFQLDVDQYPEDAQVSQCEDLAVNLTIEHSYLGDLDILVTCPNGTTVSLLSYPNGGGGTFLGEPVDDGYSTPGTGYDYSWSSSPDNPSNVNSSSNWTTLSYTDNAGNLETANVVDAGSYTPEGNLCDFTGCPLNGTWTLTLVDNLYLDDGHVFGWGMEFGVIPLSDLVVSVQSTIGFGPDSATWSGTGILNQDYASWHSDFILEEPGLHDFTFTTLNSMGCIHDTTIQVNAVEAPEMNISTSEDILWCGEPLPLTASVGEEAPSPCANAEESVTYCYSNNETTTWTYCPDEAGDGTMMSLAFKAGSLENFFDHLYVYDGIDESAALLLDLTGEWDAINVTANNDFGCLYVVLTSDGSNSCNNSDDYAPIEWCSSCGATNCAYDWSWEPTEGLSNPLIASPQIEGLEETTTFIATVHPVNMEFCATTDTVVVQLPEYDWECDGGAPCMDGTTWDEGLGQCIYSDPCPWDLTGDGQVTTSDLLSFLGAFATFCDSDGQVIPDETSYCGPGTMWSTDGGGCIPDTACPADFSGDGVVSLADLLVLLPVIGNFCE